MNIKTIGCWVFILSLASCGRDLSDDPIPRANFPDITINLNLQEYQSLNTTGYKAISGGVRGIIIRKEGSTYIAYERNCSYRPSEACATVDVHTSGLFMIDSCCGSSFNFSDGSPSGGPAWRPLNRYYTQLTGTTLTITDEIINN